MAAPSYFPTTLPSPLSTAMALPIAERYRAVVITPKGEFFGSVQGRDFRETIDQLVGEGRTNVVLNLGETTLMDSSGIGVLIESAEKLRAKQGDLRLAEMEKKMRNLFLMSRLLGDVFRSYPSVDEAVESFNEAA